MHLKTPPLSHLGKAQHPKCQALCQGISCLHPWGGGVKELVSVVSKTLLHCCDFHVLLEVHSLCMCRCYLHVHTFLSIINMRNELNHHIHAHDSN